jgi:DNA-binding transcriptional ArsR family regulator
VLRIHFEPDDVLKLRVAGEPDPLWEMVLSLFRIRLGDGPLVLREWRQQAIARCPQSLLRMLMPLVPGGYWPDFLNPGEGLLGLEAGIEAVLSTPRPRLRRDLEELARQEGSLSTWSGGLADGDPATLTQLGQGLLAYHRTVIEPYWPEARAHIEADRGTRARAFLDGGFEGLFNSFRPLMRWQPPVLEVAVPLEEDLYLNGRGLVLIPSYLSWRYPDKLMDPDLPPVLVYPVQHDLVLSARVRGSQASLGALVGPTRAMILDSVRSGHSTTELARQVGVSAGAISQHAGVLREAGLILTSRVGKAAVHTLTPTGIALLEASGGPVTAKLRP